MSDTVCALGKRVVSILHDTGLRGMDTLGAGLAREASLAYEMDI